MSQGHPNLVQDHIRINVNIDPGSSFTLTPESQPVLGQLGFVPPPLPPVEPGTTLQQAQAQAQAQNHIHSSIQPAGSANAECWDEAAQADDDSTSITSTSTTDTEKTTTSETSKTPEEESAPMPNPIFDAPLRPRMEIPHPIPNHAGYFYGPGGAAMYAGGRTSFYGPGEQDITPGKAQANAQLMMQGMGSMGGNVGMGGMHLHIWQQPYWGWM